MDSEVRTDGFRRHLLSLAAISINNGEAMAVRKETFILKSTMHDCMHLHCICFLLSSRLTIFTVHFYSKGCLLLRNHLLSDDVLLRLSTWTEDEAPDDDVCTPAYKVYSFS